MLYGNLNHTDTYAGLLQIKAWAIAFDWLKKQGVNAEPGIHKIQGEEMYANVHGYATLGREACRFEAHRAYVDLQYAVRGGELIEWQDVGSLAETTEYDVDKDLQFFEDKKSLNIVHMTPGAFATFLPHEAHMPKLADGVNAEVFKLVIKIPFEWVRSKE